jgi:hypothetical protein
MQIYDIKHLREKVQLDVEGYKSFDDYLFKNPTKKRLAYAYVKNIQGSIQLSRLIEIFEESDEVNFYSSPRYFSMMLNDETYRQIFHKYIKDPFTWVNAASTIQSYMFDSKRLLNGDYQQNISTSVELAINAVQTHYSVGFSSIHSTPAHQKHYQTEYFDKKLNLEDTFFKNFFELLGFEKRPAEHENLIIQTYHNIIELYDKDSELTLQIDIRKYTNSIAKILMPKTSKRNTYDKRNTLVLKFLFKNQLAEKIYRQLIDTSNINLINDYLDDLQKLKELPEYKVLCSIAEQFLIDLRDKKDYLYTSSSWIATYSVHYQYVERNVIHFSDRNQLLRLYKKVHLTDEDNSVLEYRMMSLPRNVQKSSKILVDYGLMTISNHQEHLHLSTFKNLANGLSNVHSQNFMRYPIADVKYVFKEVDADLENLATYLKLMESAGKEVIFEDTRKWSNTIDSTISTCFEVDQYLSNKAEFIEQRKDKLVLKNQAINDFLSKSVMNDVKFINNKIKENEKD